MPQSLAKNYVHIIFSTKYREASITDEVEKGIIRLPRGDVQRHGLPPH
jgi:hypothetical protein